MNKKHTSSEMVNLVLSVLFLVSGYLYDIWYLIRNGRILLDSDMAAEMVLADLLNKNHSFLVTDWFYSTEIKVFGPQIFYRIGLFLSPDNWLIARTIGTSMLLALLAMSIIFLMRAAKLKTYCFWSAGFAMWPLGFWYCFQSTFGGYYLSYAIYSFWVLFCVIKLQQAVGKKAKAGYYVFLGLLSFTSGLNGVRQMMVLFAPLLLAAILMYFLQKKEYMMQAAYAFLCNLGGYLINMFYFAKKYSYVTQDEYAWGGGTDSWLISLKWYFESFGYKQAGDNHAIRLFSFEGIAAGCGLVIGFVILFSMLYLLCRWKKLQEESLFLFAVCVSMLFVIGFVFTYLHGAMQYWQQTMAFGFIAMIICIDALDWKAAHMPLVSVGLMAVLTIVSARGTVYASQEYPMRANAQLVKVVEWLEENTTYDKGRAEFWESSVVTELSNGKIEMLTVSNSWVPLTPEPWLQQTSHVTYFPDEYYFVLCRHSDDPADYYFLTNELQAVCIYDDGTFVVFAVG